MPEPDATIGAPKVMPAEFGIPTATFVIVASMVGVGVLTTSGFTVLFVGSNQLMLGLWVLGGITAACGALTLCELSAALPKSGGDYVYLYEAFGPLVAFLSGWVSFLIGFAAPAAAAAIGAAMYLTAPFGLQGATALAVQRALATALIVVFALIHVSGRKQTAHVQGWVTAVKLAILGLFVVAGLVAGRSHFGNLADLPPITYDRFDLRLMPTAKDVSAIPTAGNRLVIVAAVDQVLHFRIFDNDGKRIVDTDETRRTAQSHQIEDLRKQLKTMWPPRELTTSEKRLVIDAVISITGHTSYDLFMAMMSSLVYISYAYLGWNAASYLAGEFVDPQRQLPRAILLGMVLVVGLYVGLNVVYALALSAADIRAIVESPSNTLPPGQKEEAVGAIANLAAARLFTPALSTPFTVAIGLMLLSSLSAYLLTGPRVIYAMAVAGQFPAVAGKLTPRAGTPAVATALQTAVTLVLVWIGSLAELVKYAGIGLAIFSMLAVSSVYVLRWTRPDLPRPFRTPGYPVTPAVFLVVNGALTFASFRSTPVISTYAILSILAGVPVYYAWNAVRREAPAGA